MKRLEPAFTILSSKLSDQLTEVFRKQEFDELQRIVCDKVRSLKRYKRSNQVLHRVLNIMKELEEEERK